MTMGVGRDASGQTGGRARFEVMKGIVADDGRNGLMALFTLLLSVDVLVDGQRATMIANGG